MPDWYANLRTTRGGAGCGSPHHSFGGLRGAALATAAERLDEALRASDDRSRPERVQRIVWLSVHDGLPGAIMGRAETLHLMHEAREVFVNGHYAAALLLAISVINHSLIEELQVRGSVKGDPGLHAVLAKSEELLVLPVEWFPPIRQLVSRRHPFVHFKEPDHEHALGARVMQDKTHPARLLETDAQDAIMFMYRVFRATLREAAFVAADRRQASLAGSLDTSLLGGG